MLRTILILTLAVLSYELDPPLLLLLTLTLGLWLFNRAFGLRARLRRALARADKMDGEAFERFAARMFRYLGYRVTLTRQTRDYGCDLILEKRGKRIGVQAKNYGSRNVGNSAVQQAMAGAAYYECDQAMVVTTACFTSSARAQAEHAAPPVTLVDLEAMKRFLS